MALRIRYTIVEHSMEYLVRSLFESRLLHNEPDDVEEEIDAVVAEYKESLYGTFIKMFYQI